MKLFLLDETDNLTIQRQLVASTKTEHYTYFIVEVMQSLNIDYTRTDELSNKVFLLMNKIILDNLFKHVRYHSPDQLITLVTNRTFHLDLYVNPFYLDPIKEMLHIDDIDITEKENLLIKRLANILSHSYTSNVENFNRVLLEVFTKLYNYFSYMDIYYYKFELYERTKPLLLYTENLDNAYS